jgi:cation transport regulator ChaC
MALVFQYGSNAMRSRLNGHSRLDGQADDRGAACTVDDFDIAFDVWSQTNGCAACDLIQVPGRFAWGVLYDIPEEFIRGRRNDGQRTLAQIEGPRYQETAIRIRNQEGQEVDAVTFVVRDPERRVGIATSAAYVSWIVYGLREHGAPEEYIEHVVAVAIETNERAGNGAAELTRIIRTL